MVSSDNHHQEVIRLEVGAARFRNPALMCSAIRCVNPECNELYLAAKLGSGETGSRGWWEIARERQTWRLLPDSASIAQPDYIPAPLREDYYEACLIRDKSPKASATLARRCLQGMIRDFCDISRPRLIEEIRELRRLVDLGQAPKGVEVETIDAIDAVRDVGNIGAHMERDISLIIDVDPGEAQTLIELIELLFQDWYVARHKRTQRLLAVRAMAAEKQAEITAGRAEIAQQKLSAEADAVASAQDPET
ncbi:DUF4145 domain-containing protein [Rhizobium sp. TRM95111]|uniref:DUF4145 domain-containing protein n=1 Tax=Rhizobium alarense TaxID=2846851 RepID=UPI001F1A5878|nr:DUF4145 domain-containing protein [Rhizobium alarense]MCF3641871.1 DUF4145 domain-containing protein [Rhizobium alarense]